MFSKMFSTSSKAHKKTQGTSSGTPPVIDITTATGRVNLTEGHFQYTNVQQQQQQQQNNEDDKVNATQSKDHELDEDLFSLHTTSSQSMDAHALLLTASNHNHKNTNTSNDVDGGNTVPVLIDIPAATVAAVAPLRRPTTDDPRDTSPLSLRASQIDLDDLEEEDDEDMPTLSLGSTHDGHADDKVAIVATSPNSKDPQQHQLQQRDDHQLAAALQQHATSPRIRTLYSDHDVHTLVNVSQRLLLQDQGIATTAGGGTGEGTGGGSHRGASETEQHDQTGTATTTTSTGSLKKAFVAATMIATLSVTAMLVVVNTIQWLFGNALYDGTMGDNNNNDNMEIKMNATLLSEQDVVTSIKLEPYSNHHSDVSTFPARLFQTILTGWIGAMVLWVLAMTPFKSTTISEETVASSDGDGVDTTSHVVSPKFCSSPRVRQDPTTWMTDLNDSHFDLSWYDSLKVYDLRTMLRQRGCTSLSKGKREVLVRRLVMLYQTELATRTVKELRPMLKRRGLKQKPGEHKIDMVRRLVESGL